MKMSLFEYKPGRIYGGSLPQERDLIRIRGSDIDVVISLETDYPLPDFEGHGLEHYELPLREFGIPSDEDVIRFIRLLKDVFSQGKTVLVHCFAGCGRTGTMLALAELYLFEEDTATGAIKKVRSIRPCAIETTGQENVIARHASYPLETIE
ncbi:MAG: dual specificity protein phosphatase family protein [Candidatus Thorarchaeota archaeon]|nr:dual specificity protein phosphatase family protein [Candidatus Thorarchaeota archaeon]